MVSLAKTTLSPFAQEVKHLIEIGTESHLLYEELMSLKVNASADGKQDESKIWAEETRLQLEAHNERIGHMMKVAGLTENAVKQLFNPHVCQRFYFDTMRELGCVAQEVGAELTVAA